MSCKSFDSSPAEKENMKLTVALVGMPVPSHGGDAPEPGMPVAPHGGEAPPSPVQSLNWGSVGQQAPPSYVHMVVWLHAAASFVQHCIGKRADRSNRLSSSSSSCGIAVLGLEPNGLPPVLGLSPTPGRSTSGKEPNGLGLSPNPGRPSSGKESNGLPPVLGLSPNPGIGGARGKLNCCRRRALVMPLINPRAVRAAVALKVHRGWTSGSGQQPSSV